MRPPNLGNVFIPDSLELEECIIEAARQLGTATVDQLAARAGYLVDKDFERMLRQLVKTGSLRRIGDQVLYVPPVLPW